jgi:hypothetical protein
VAFSQAASSRCAPGRVRARSVSASAGPVRSGGLRANRDAHFPRARERIELFRREPAEANQSGPRSAAGTGRDAGQRGRGPRALALPRPGQPRRTPAGQAGRSARASSPRQVTARARRAAHRCRRRGPRRRGGRSCRWPGRRRCAAAVGLRAQLLGARTGQDALHLVAGDGLVEQERARRSSSSSRECERTSDSARA